MSLVQQLRQLFLEALQILKVPVHGGKPNVGNFIQIFEFFHHALADFLRRNFLSHRHPLRFQPVDHAAHLLLRNLAFFARLPNAFLDFVPAVGFARAVFFNHEKICGLDLLERGESEIAFFTLAAAADLAAAFGFARVNDLGVVVCAFGASHKVVLQTGRCTPPHNL